MHALFVVKVVLFASQISQFMVDSMHLDSFALVGCLPNKKSPQRFKVNLKSLFPFHSFQVINELS